MTMIHRSAPDATPALALTDPETALLDQLVPDKREDPARTRALSVYLIKVARLVTAHRGGILGCAGRLDVSQGMDGSAVPIPPERS